MGFGAFLWVREREREREKRMVSVSSSLSLTELAVVAHPCSSYVHDCRSRVALHIIWWSWFLKLGVLLFAFNFANLTRYRSCLYDMPIKSQLSKSPTAVAESVKPKWSKARAEAIECDFRNFAFRHTCSHNTASKYTRAPQIDWQTYVCMERTPFPALS